jgi:hypothetical protein
VSGAIGPEATLEHLQVAQDREHDDVDEHAERRGEAGLEERERLREQEIDEDGELERAVRADARCA